MLQGQLTGALSTRARLSDAEHTCHVRSESDKCSCSYTDRCIELLCALYSDASITPLASRNVAHTASEAAAAAAAELTVDSAHPIQLHHLLSILLPPPRILLLLLFLLPSVRHWSTSVWCMVDYSHHTN